jgi:hypothetical protein
MSQPSPLPTIMLRSPRLLSSGICPSYGECRFFSVLSWVRIITLYIPLFGLTNSVVKLSAHGSRSQPCSANPSQTPVLSLVKVNNYNTFFARSHINNLPGVGGGIVQNFGVKDEILFLEISLSENWLIFITRANGPFWSSIPSWQLTGAILLVDILATMFCLFGWFIGGNTSIVAIVRVWIFSFGVFCVMGGIYYLLQDSQGFDNLMHGKSPKKDQKQRSLEDFGKISTHSSPPYFATNPVSSCLVTTCLHTAREECLNHRYPRPKMGRRKKKKTIN